jgi:hypothetical protein
MVDTHIVNLKNLQIMVNPHVASRRRFVPGSESAESAPKNEGSSPNLPPLHAKADSVSESAPDSLGSRDKEKSTGDIWVG